MPFEVVQLRNADGTFGFLVKRYHCDSCAMVRVNGTPVHEIGCPDAWQDYERECRECGCAFVPEDRHQAVCGDCNHDN